MKILFFHISLITGGTGRVIVTLANYWAQRGHNVIILTLAPVAKDFYPYHSSIERMSFNESGKKYNALFTIVKNIFRVFRIRGVLRYSNPDIAMGIGDRCSTLLGLASISMRNIVTIGAEHSHPPMKKLFERMNGVRSWAYGKLSAVVALTEKTAQWLQTNTSAKKVVVIPNAIEWPMPVKKYTHETIPPELTNCTILLAVSRYTEEAIQRKGMDMLIPIFASLASQFPNWNLVILGGGEDQDILEQMIDQHSMRGRIFLPGTVSDMPLWYKAASLFALSSRHEGLAMVLIEAMSCGCPVVSFNCDVGPSDIIDNGTNGILVPPENASALREVLRQLMGDSAFRNRLGNQGTAIVQKFSMEKIIGRWEKLFQEL